MSPTPTFTIKLATAGTLSYLLLLKKARDVFGHKSPYEEKSVQKERPKGYRVDLGKNCNGDDKIDSIKSVVFIRGI